VILLLRFILPVKTEGFCMRPIASRRFCSAKRTLSRLLFEALEARTMMASDLSWMPEGAGTWTDPSGQLIGTIARPIPSGVQNGPRPNQGGEGGDGQGDGPSFAPLADTFKLHSRPTATKTIYMDFDGFTAVGTSWNRAYNIQQIVSPAFDPDGNGAAFSDNELRTIQAAWQRVAADFAPFDVNVTTEDPGEEALVNTGGNDNRWGMRVVITLENFSNQPVGGFAYIGSFRWGYEGAGASDTPCYVFNSFSRDVSAAVSHEVGHSLGLSHDGTNSDNPFQQNAEYYDGHGGSVENSWGPIMGSGYYRNVTTWDDGIYYGANNGGANANYNSGPNDLSVITSTANGFGFLPDDHANTIEFAREVTGPVDASDRIALSTFGTIETSVDRDVIWFQSGSGVVNLSIDPYITQVWTSQSDGSYRDSIDSALFTTGFWPNNQGSNLDVQATLYDASGNVVATSNPDGLRASFTDLNLSAGIYYLEIDGVGFGDPRANVPTGYSDFGSLGQYMVTGSIPVAFGVALSSTVVSYIENDLPIPLTTIAKVIDIVPGDYSSGALSVAMVPQSGSTDFITLRTGGSSPFSLQGNVLLHHGEQMGTFLRSSSTDFVVNFTANATKDSIESLVEHLDFEARGDAPDVFQRSVQLVLNKGSFRGVSQVQVRVRAVNDRPIATATFMNNINEDDRSPAGTTVAQLIERGVVDVDLTTATGIAITGGNSGGPAGNWQLNVGTGWSDLPSVSSTSALVLGPTAQLRFLPAANYFGPAPDLMYLALDPTYTGSFSDGGTLWFVDIGQVQAPDSISSVVGEIKQFVQPVNDAPFAVPPTPSASGVQDAFLQFVIPSGLFQDIDDTVLRYSAYTSPGVPLPSWMRFDPLTRTFSGTPGNSDVGMRQVFVRATDGAGAAAESPVLIDIANVNDAPTNIELLGVAIPENLRGARLGRLLATDPDPNDSIQWTTNDPRFLLKDDELFLAPTVAFDFEASPTARVLIRATDNGTPQLSYEKEIVITVSDVNEFSPNLEPIAFEVSENAAGGTTVGRIVATDADTANTVRYRFFGNPPTQFALDPVTGVLSVRPNAVLDFESNPQFRFFVEAFDNGTPSLSTWTSAVVSLIDVNEFAPQITTTSLNVSEVQSVGASFGRIQATDGDRQGVVFSLPANETRFAIQPNTGDLSVLRTGVLDFERSATEFVTVIVTDTGVPALQSQRVIRIQVLNVNEPPTSVSVPNGRVLSNVTGWDLGAISVVDPDGPTPYSVIALDPRFEVVNNSLRLLPGVYFSDVDPLVTSVNLMLTDTVGGLVRQLILPIERVENPAPWRNVMMPWDVNRSGSVDPLDALVLVNAFNKNPSGTLTNPRSGDSLSEPDVDVDGDGQLTPLDVLAVVNRINGVGGAQGEGSSEVSSLAGVAAPPSRRMETPVDLYFANWDAEEDRLESNTGAVRRNWRSRR